MGLLTRHFLKVLMNTLYRIADRIDILLERDEDRPVWAKFDPEFACGECDCSECVFGDCCIGCECEMCEEERAEDFKEFKQENNVDDGDDDDDWNILRFVR